jgi:hypothetical protein
MGRSVMTVPDAVTAFDTFTPEHYCEECDDFAPGCGCEIYCNAYCDHSEQWRAYLDYVETRAIEMFPSMTAEDYFLRDGETHVVASNGHAIVSVAEYCGIIAVSLAPNFDRREYWREPSESAGLSQHWRSQVSERFLAEFSEYRRVATASNGESFYERIAS